MERYLERLKDAPEYLSLLNGLAAGPGEQAVYGLSGSMQTYVLAGLAHHTGRPCLVLTASAQAAERVRDDLATWLPGRDILIFPQLELAPFDILAHSPEVAAQRLAVLQRLAAGERPIVVAPVAALRRALVPPEAFAAACLTCRSGDRVDLDRLLQQLVELGYERVEMVEGRGQFSLRGGILDVFPLDAEQPLRVELFDDEIDSIRRFDPATQRSTGAAPELFLPPAREHLVPVAAGALASAREAIRADLAVMQAKLRGNGAAAERLKERVESHLTLLERGTGFEGSEQYLPYLFDRVSTLIEYFPSGLMVVKLEPARLYETLEGAKALARERDAAWLQHGGMLPRQAELEEAWPVVETLLRRRAAVSFSLLLRKSGGIDPSNIVSVVCKPMQSFHGQWSLLLDELGRLKSGRYETVIVSATEDRAQRLREGLRESEIEPGAVRVMAGTLESGFQWPALRLAVITDSEVFGRTKARRKVPVRAASKDAVRLRSHHDLDVGDYVVHVNHGIGRYLGVKTLEVAGVHKDYLYIQYDGEDRLYVPTEQISLVQKYVGAEGHEPRLYKLGGADWSKVKTRIKESIQKMAIELLRLQAIRASQPGYAFSPDSVWQKEFEDAFKYEETPDQLQAAEEIKRDMEKPRPMDRLLCGDVGYGKTEVAIRAVFKAVMDSKQVAVLVPTTILAQQHYNTFRERFAGYPVRIGLLNRFRTASEQATTIAAMEKGELDVVIGTHRLLSPDVRFKDLGLLVIDEEQRFGVGHKERIKLLRQNVDVLTLSATPIPRTLHMAMVGMRDMSTIETPPEERFPVETYVAEYSDALVIDAISREIARGGQVFYLYNRIATIERTAAHLQQLLPDARIGVAHGKMSEEQLESVIMAFLEGDYDVLVCTTIIESGIDIPNVNTLVVEDADHFGLAQLYQLRGRVGRSNRLAYAYFLYRRDKVLTEVAEKRLAAIREFTEFGSGFKIALRDLEIRGAGNILGPEQHGFIISVGFDLYCQLLEETVRELKGEKVVSEPEPNIELAIDAYIPDSYIGDPKQKIEAYQSVMAVRQPRDAYDLAEELQDRYGAMPRPVEHLLALARLKALCQAAGVTSIQQQRDRVTLKLQPGKAWPADAVATLQRRYRNRVSLGTGKTPALVLRVQGLGPDDLLGLLEDAVPLLNRAVATV